MSGHFYSSSARSEEHTSELQSHSDLVCRLLLEKKRNGRVSRRHRPRPRTSRWQPRSGRAQKNVAKCPRQNREKNRRTMNYLQMHYFFLNNPAPPEIYHLPPPAPLPT